MTLEEQIDKTIFGLAFIIPAIFVLRWFLTRHTGSAEEWAEQQKVELADRLAQGKIDQETYERRIRELDES